jgi:hypothetical protein
VVVAGEVGVDRVGAGVGAELGQFFAEGDDLVFDRGWQSGG